MAQRVRSFPDLPQHTQTVTLGDAQYRLRLTWRERPAAWYLDILALDDTLIVAGRRLSPQFSPTLGFVLESGPDGLLYVRGTFDPYPRQALGQTIDLFRFADSELTDPDPPADDGVVVTLSGP